MTRVDAIALRLLEVDLAICRRATSAQSRPVELGFFRVVSWLGDGPFWFGLALVLPIALGATVLELVARLALVGAAATVTSKGLKVSTRRARPFRAHPEIPAAARALDSGSFPSGHTLHAVAFTLVTVAALPWCALLLVPFTLAIAASRVVLGLHYPSDVVAGAAIGGLLGAVALAIL
jgi:undecaprenyl-diphosphatase